MSLGNDFELTNQISPDGFRPLVSYATVVIYVMMSLTARAQATWPAMG